MTQEQLAVAADISRKRISEIETRWQAFSYDTLNSVATALGVKFADLDPIDAQTIRATASESTVAWTHMMRNVFGHEAVAKAVGLDLAGLHDQAVAMLEHSLSKVPKADVTSRNVHLFKIASVLGNAGDHDRALEILDGISAEARRTGRVEDEDERWAQYHRTIELRRVGRIEEAFSEFEKMLQWPLFKPGAQHQLGVCCLIRGYLERDTHARELHLREALEWFAKCMKAYDKQDPESHRRGFTPKRIAQVYALLNMPDEAMHFLLDALSTFSRFQATRYIEATRADIRRLLRARRFFESQSNPKWGDLRFDESFHPDAEEDDDEKPGTSGAEDSGGPQPPAGPAGEGPGSGVPAGKRPGRTGSGGRAAAAGASDVI
jgi:tetratricopeptide (TPR) repeat protein